MEEQSYIKMDYSLETQEERVKKVEEIIANTPPERLTPHYKEKLADYIIEAMNKKERKERYITTANRNTYRKEREMSFEGLVGKLENGEDGIYGMIANDKNIIFRPKDPITEKDIEEIPELKELVETINKLKERLKKASGHEARILKEQIIALSKDQYVIRASRRQTIFSNNLTKTISKLNLAENVTIDAEGHVHSDGILNFYDEDHISALLCNYSKLKEECWEKLNDDGKWLMEDFDALVDAALKEKYPLYYELVILKIDGKQNVEIQQALYEKFGIRNSIEYLSSLWRNKIPKLIKQEAENRYLIWYYTYKERGNWKICTRCGQKKLAHNNFFSKNKSSKDHFYSICKECRNKK